MHNNTHNLYYIFHLIYEIPMCTISPNLRVLNRQIESRFFTFKDLNLAGTSVAVAPSGGLPPPGERGEPGLSRRTVACPY